MIRNILERMGALTQNCHLATTSKTVGMAVMVALETDCNMVLVHLHYRPQLQPLFRMLVNTLKIPFQHSNHPLQYPRYNTVVPNIPHPACPHLPGP